MAGYNGFSKSNNAIAAEREGRFPLSRAAKQAGVPAELIKRFVRAGEWHHSSSWYNRVDYYDVAEIKAVFGLASSEDFDAIPAAVEALAAHAPAKTEAVRHEGCSAEWIEWSGSRTRPVAHERKAAAIAVTISGAFATLHLPGGDLRKKLTARGFELRGADGKVIAAWWKA